MRCWSRGEVAAALHLPQMTMAIGGGLGPVCAWLYGPRPVYQ
jgi:hypothetical protein